MKKEFSIAILFEKIKNFILPFALSIIGSLSVLYPINPANNTVLGRDSGVFLYIGWRLLRGEIPYKDIWDHKPPLIYFTDAAGIWLTPESMWGVWLIQFFFVALTILFVYKAIQENFDAISALFGTVILISSLLTILETGNLTEEYALPFQAFALWQIPRACKKNFPLRNTFFIGLAGGIAFYYKQNTIGIWLSFGIFLILYRIIEKKHKAILKDLLALGAGVFILSGIFVLYFYLNNSLSNFWELAFQYNFLYIKKGEFIPDLLRVINKGSAFYSRSWMLQFSIIGVFLGLLCTLKNKKDCLQKTNHLLLFALLSGFVEFIMINISGRAILHYYLTPLPVMAIFSSYLIAFPIKYLPELSTPSLKPFVTLTALFLIAISQFQQVRTYPERIEISSQNNYQDLLNYIDKNTTSEDKVLFIEAETAFNFLSRRVSPTRFVYQFTIQLLGNKNLVEAFFYEVIENQPALIVDARGKENLGEKLYPHFQSKSAYVKESVQYLVDNYEPVLHTKEGWVIYSLEPTP